MKKKEGKKTIIFLLVVDFSLSVLLFRYGQCFLIAQYSWNRKLQRKWNNANAILNKLIKTNFSRSVYKYIF